jgi:hypothetical protein
VTFDFGTPAVQSHLEMLQGVIQRMAENSRSCKLWSITALSAVLFLAARTGVPWYTLIALVPLSLFFLLDVYYLSLERRFRGSYECMLEKLRSGTYGLGDVYQIVPVDFSIGILMKCLRSPSVYLYYPLALAIAGAVFAAQCLLGMGTD